MNIHLVNDETFINKAVEKFDHFYPNQHVFFVDDSNYRKTGKTKHVELKENVHLLDFSKPTAINKIIQTTSSRIENVFVHSLNNQKAFLATSLKEQLNAKIHWVFYGGDLYGWLNVLGKYELYDRNKYINNFIGKGVYLMQLMQDLISLKTMKILNVKKRFVRELNSFCFWNPNDFELLKKHFKTNAVFKLFIYPVLNIPENYTKTEYLSTQLIINQSSSKTGNHITIFKKLHKLSHTIQLDKITVPLSYGNKRVRKSILKVGRKFFLEKFNPLLSFYEKDAYQKIIHEHSIAIYGHRRQEAGGNILMSLSIGVKVFLRKDNNLLAYFKNKGYHIYEFETDLNSEIDLQPLDERKARRNLELIKLDFSDESIDEIYKKFLD